MEIADLAVHHVVSTADARSIGVGRTEIRRLAAAGRILRLDRGWYAVCAPGQVPPWVGEDRFATQRARHRLRTAAHLRQFEGRVVASHHSALLLHDIALLEADLGRVHVCRTTGTQSRRREGVTVHGSVGGPQVSSPSGLRTVSVATAVVQTGLVNPPLGALVAADSALHRGLCTDDEVEDVLRRFHRVPGVAPVRLLLGHRDRRHESPGETRLAQVLRGLGLCFTPQVWVTTRGRRWRVDFMLDDVPVVIEFDGMGKYRADEDALRQEKWREDALRHAGYRFVRVTWPQLDRPEEIGRAIEEARADCAWAPRTQVLGGAVAHEAR